METKQCPICGEEIAADAKKCRYCGEWIEEKIESSQPTSASNPRPKLTIMDAGGKDECTGFFNASFIEPFIKWKSESQIPRKTFWLSILAYYIVALGLSGLAMLLAASIENVGVIIGAILLIVFSLYTIVPFFKLSAGRLRDAGYSPWLNLLVLIPILGSIALIVLWCMPSKFSHEPRNVKFGIIDIVITVASVALIIAGPAMLAVNLAKLLESDDSYNEYSYVDEVDDSNYIDYSNYNNSDEIQYNDYVSYDNNESNVVEEEVVEEESEYTMGDPDFLGDYDGKVGSYPVRMNLAVTGQNEIFGSYYYTSQGEDRQIQLKGTIDDNFYKISKGEKSRVTIYELDKYDQKCGFFELVFTQVNDAKFTSEKRFTITGTYRNYSSGRTFNVELSKY